MDEYRDLKKELEQTAKNCRILQFKLRKSDRRIEQLEAARRELEAQIQDGSVNTVDKRPSRVERRAAQTGKVVFRCSNRSWEWRAIKSLKRKKNSKYLRMN